MRTTVTIDDELLAQAKLIALRTHRTIGSVLEDALRQLIAAEGRRVGGGHALPDFSYAGGLRPGVDLYDKDAMAQILYDDPDGSALS